METVHDVGVDLDGPQEVVVAMFDVLGFRQLIDSHDLWELNRRYRELLALKRRAGIIPVLSLGGVQRWKSPSAVFSDTFLFWSKPEPEAVDSFLTTCSVLLAEAAEAGWPLRGGISLGECIVDRRSRVFLGKPVVEAYLTEQSQEWVGVGITDSCLNHAELGALFRNNDNTCQYSVPVKVNATPIEVAISWGERLQNPIGAVQRMKEAAPSGAKVKCDNTITFLRWEGHD